MKHFLKNGLCCIYLDQFASSELFKPKREPIWNEIRYQLFNGYEQKKLICPLSSEHFMETSQMELQRAIHLNREFEKLSCGYAFKPALFITSQLIISAMRNNNITPKTYLYDNIKKDILAQKENIEEFDKAKKELNTKIEEATYFANDLRQIERFKKYEGKTKEILLKAHKSISVNSFINRLYNLLENDHIFIEGVHFPSGDIPHWVDLVIHQLLKKHRMSRKETKLLIVHFKKYGFNRIPILDIRTTLSAIIAVNNKQQNVNDEVDILRVSTGLPISDILLTDKKRKHEIVISGLDKKYNTKVFSGVRNDLEKLIKELKNVNQN